MTVEQKIAKSLIREFGFEFATEQTKEALDRSMRKGSIKDIELQQFWREILVELMRARN